MKGCTDALSRQVGEAVRILLQGNLNSKLEFGLNHLCRLVSSKDPWEADKTFKDEMLSRQKTKSDLGEFITVMKEVSKIECDRLEKKVYPLGRNIYWTLMLIFLTDIL